MKDSLNYNAFPKYVKIFSFIIALTLILNCNSIWISVPVYTYKFTFGLLTLLIISIIIILSYEIKVSNGIEKNKLITYIFLLIYLIGYVMLTYNSNSIVTNIRSIIIITFLFFYVKLDRKENVLQLMIHYYINLMIIIGSISLFFWTFGSILKLIPSTGYVLSNWGISGNKNLGLAPSYLNIYFETQLAGNVVRNSSIFAEAPMASLNFSIALILESCYYSSFEKNKTLLIKEFILSICILTTISFTGYIVLVMLLLGKSVFLKVKNKNAIKLVGTLFLSIAGIFIIRYLFMQKLGNTSGQIRQDDYRAGWEALKTSPILGLGTNSTGVQNFMSSWRSYNLGFSNTILDLLVQNGIYIFILILYSIIYSLISSLKTKNYNKLIFIFIYVYLFCTTIFTKTYIMFFIFIWMTNKWNNEISKN